jgi:hypothetical protein
MNILRPPPISTLVAKSGDAAVRLAVLAALLHAVTNAAAAAIITTRIRIDRRPAVSSCPQTAAHVFIRRRLHARSLEAIAVLRLSLHAVALRQKSA